MDVAACVSVAYDPGDPAFRADPYPALKALRLRAPVYRRENGEWVVARYAEVRNLLGDARLDVTQPGADLRRGARSGDSFQQRREEGLRLFAAILQTRERADHQRLRRIARGPFARNEVARRRTRIQAWTDDRIDQALADGRMDVIADLSLPIAGATIGDLVGIPDEMVPRFVTATAEFTHRSTSMRPESTRNEGCSR